MLSSFMCMCFQSQAYTAYGNTVNIESKSIRKVAAPAAGAAAAAKKK